MVRSIAVVASALLLAGCYFGSRAHELAALQKVAPGLLQAVPVSGALLEERWPAELKQLGAKSVYARPEGVYVVTSGFFVRESGIFLPRWPSFQASRGSDPAYTRIVEGLYSYSVKG